jgi:hypothetical protein
VGNGEETEVKKLTTSDDFCANIEKNLLKQATKKIHHTLLTVITL